MFQRITEETFDMVFPLLERAFPVTELREKERQKALLQEPCYRLYGVAGEAGMQAAFAAWEIADFLYIDHFVVREDCRNNGYGGMLLDKFIQKMNRPVVLEVEMPEEEMARRRIGFYKRHGFAYNEYPYMQPPMRKGLGMVPLRLMTNPAAIDKKTYERYRTLIHRIAYHYEEGHPMKYCFGIDIGGTTVKIGLFSGMGAMLARWEIPTRKGAAPDGLLQDVKEALENCLAERRISRSDVIGCGITAPGPVTEDGILHGTVNIGWGDVALAKEAERIFGLGDVRIGNDARVAALGEYVYGAGRGTKSMLMITLGTGVGGGVVQDGQILTGFHGVAGEIGHTTVDPYETLACTCGKKGCLEQYASATGMVRVAEKFLAEWEGDSLLRQEGRITAKALWDCAKAGDSAAGKITDFVCSRLGIALANAAYLVDPEIFVIGGGVSAAGKFLLDKVENVYRANVFPHSRDKKFALAELGNDAGIQGAAALLLAGRQ